MHQRVYKSTNYLMAFITSANERKFNQVKEKVQMNETIALYWN